MTKEALAAALSGREYPIKITKDEEDQAKKSNLVIIFGASDDLLEFRGAIEEEVGAYNGIEALISGNRVLEEIEDEELDVLRKHDVLHLVRALRDKAIKVTATWCKGKDYSWFIDASVPFAPFDIMEEGTTFCRAIVVELPSKN